MIDILLGLIIYILGIFTGIIIPIVVYKYYNLFNTKKIETQVEEQQTGDLKTNNITADIISEWQTGEVVGDNNE